MISKEQYQEANYQYQRMRGLNLDLALDAVSNLARFKAKWFNRASEEEQNEIAMLLKNLIVDGPMEAPRLLSRYNPNTQEWQLTAEQVLRLRVLYKQGELHHLNKQWQAAKKVLDEYEKEGHRQSTVITTNDQPKQKSLIVNLG